MGFVRSGARAVILTDLPDHVPILAANAAASLGAVSAARARLGIEESEGTDGYNAELPTLFRTRLRTFGRGSRTKHYIFLKNVL